MADTRLNGQMAVREDALRHSDGLTDAHCILLHVVLQHCILLRVVLQHCILLRVVLQHCTRTPLLPASTRSPTATGTVATCAPSSVRGRTTTA